MDGKTIAELIKAFGELLWPLFAIGALFVARPFIGKLLLRDNVHIKVGSTELSIGQATADIGKAVTDIQAKLANMSEQLESLGTGGGGTGASSDRPKAEERHNAAPPSIQDEIEGKAESSRLRILWVDDVPSNNAFLIERLRGMGHEVDASLGTTDALSKLKTTKYDCIISDLGRIENGMVNPLAGMQLIERVREGGDEIPILIFASSRAKKIESQLFAAGATNVTNSGIDVIYFVDAWAARARKA